MSYFKSTEKMKADMDKPSSKDKLTNSVKKAMLDLADESIAGDIDKLYKARCKGFVEFGLKANLEHLQEVYDKYVSGFAPLEKDGSLHFSLEFALVLTMKAILLEMDRVKEDLFCKVAELPWGQTKNEFTFHPEVLKSHLTDRCADIAAASQFSAGAIPKSVLDFLNDCGPGIGVISVAHIIDWALTGTVLTRKE